MAPATAMGTAPRANQPTTLTRISRRLNPTRLRLPMSWASVYAGTASRTPSVATSTGNRMMPPPVPVTAAMVEAMNAAIATVSSSIVIPVSKRLLPYVMGTPSSNACRTQDRKTFLGRWKRRSTRARGSASASVHSRCRLGLRQKHRSSIISSIKGSVNKVNVVNTSPVER